MKTTLKRSSLCKYLAAGLFLFQFETAWSADSGTMKSQVAAPALRDYSLYEKVVADLKKSSLSQKDLQKLGPGVTGGGDSCEQKIAYSYSFLLELIENDKINPTVFNPNAQKESLLAFLKQTQFSFDRGLTKGRPVEMLNVPVMNAVLLDREICNNNFEPLSYYAPILMHEALRLTGRTDDTDYAISKSYVGLIRKEADIELNRKRNFRIFSDTANGTVAFAWGLRGEPLDFEKFDELPTEEQRKFIWNNQDKLENYVVDLKRMRILAVLAGTNNCNDCNVPDAFAEFGDVIEYNYRGFTYNFDPTAKIGFTLLYWKWGQDLSKMFAVNEKQEIIGLCTADCEAFIKTTAQKKLTPAQLQDMKQFANHYYDYAYKKSDDGFDWQVKIESENVKRLGSATYQAPMKLEFVDGKFKATIGKFKKLKNL